MMNKEHFLLFYLANVFSIFLLSYLGAILLPLGSAQGFSVLVAEIRILNDQIPFLGSLFSVAGMLIFIMANVTILDAIGRLSHRIIEPLASKRVAHFFTASRISVYAILIGIGILVLSILFPSFKQPYILLVTSASLSSIVMWLYPPLLLKLNMQLPQMVQPALWRRIMVLLCTAFYGSVSLWALSSLLPVPIVAGIGTIVTLYQIYFLFFRKM